MGFDFPRLKGVKRMQQKRQDIVEEARAIIRAFESRKRPAYKQARKSLFPFLYGALGFLSATVLGFVLRVSLFR